MCPQDLQPCSVGLVSLAKGGAYVACLLTSLLLLAARAMGTPQGFHAMALYPALLLSWGAVIAGRQGIAGSLVHGLMIIARADRVCEPCFRVNK